MGATAGQTNIRNPLLTVGTSSVAKTIIATPSLTCDLINTGSTTVNFAGAGTVVNIGSATTGTVTNLKNAEIKVGNGTTSSITTPATTFNLINDTATAVNFAGAGTVVNIGSSSGTTTVKNNLVVTGTTTFTGTVSGIDISMIAGGVSYQEVAGMIANAIAAIQPPT
jgi:hypothetical protein